MVFLRFPVAKIVLLLGNQDVTRNAGFNDSLEVLVHYCDGGRMSMADFMQTTTENELLKREHQDLTVDERRTYLRRICRRNSIQKAALEHLRRVWEQAIEKTISVFCFPTADQYLSPKF
jgi:hypothetical protein